LNYGKLFSYSRCEVAEDAGPGAAEKKFRGPIGVPGVPYPDAGLSFFLCSC